jgi:hypothetical protein
VGRAQRPLASWARNLDVTATFSLLLAATLTTPWTAVGVRVDTAAGATGATAPATPAGEGRSIVVEPATLEGQAGDEGGPVLKSSLQRALAGAQIRFADPGCDVACVDALVAESGATLRLRMSLREQNRDYTASIGWLDSSGREVARGEETCEICTVEEAADAAAAAAVKLLPAGQSTTLAITTDPAGARVTVDGAAVGATPIEVTVEAGEHEVGIELPGYRYQHRAVTVADGERAAIDLDLVAAPAAKKRKGIDRRKAWVAGWTSLGVGVALLVTGIALIAVDENPAKNDCSGDNIDAFGNCRYRWNTLGGGVAATVIGVAAAGAGVGFVVVSRPRAQVRASVGPGRTGIAIAF